MRPRRFTGRPAVAVLITVLLAGCVSAPRIPRLHRLPRLPVSAGAARMADACAVAALAVEAIVQDRADGTAALTRTPVLMNLPAENRLRGAEQSLDLRRCSAVVALALQGGMTLWAPGGEPASGVFRFSSPVFDATGDHAWITWSSPDVHTFGLSFRATRDPIRGWVLDEDVGRWSNPPAG